MRLAASIVVQLVIMIKRCAAGWLLEAVATEVCSSIVELEEMPRNEIDLAGRCVLKPCEQG